MKKLFFAVIVSTLISCSAINRFQENRSIKRSINRQLYGSRQLVKTYLRPRIGSISIPLYITIIDRKLFVMYDNRFYDVTLGDVTIKGDTLCLNPQTEFFKGNIRFLDKSNANIGTIPLYFLDTGDGLIDITTFDEYPVESFPLDKDGKGVYGEFKLIRNN